jgi:hypothetical protein
MELIQMNNEQELSLYVRGGIVGVNADVGPIVEFAHLLCTHVSILPYSYMIDSTRQ